VNLDPAHNVYISSTVHRFPHLNFDSGQPMRWPERRNEMNSRNLQSRFAASALFVLSNCLLTVQAINAANPPAQGPPPASPHAQSIKVGDLTTLLQAVITGKVDAENAKLANDPSHRAVIHMSLVQQTPYMAATRYPNRPNEFVADIAYSVTYQVTQIQANIGGVWVPYPFDRTLTQEINVEDGCEGWSTGSGVITTTIVSTAPYLLGSHSFLEEAIGALLLEEIPQYVDNQISSALADFAASSTTLSNGAACRSLGVSTIAQGNQADLVTYDPPVRIGPGSVPPPNITVRVTQIRRLQLLDAEGQPVYNPIELPHIDIYAGFTHLLLQVPPMVQGQTVALTNDNTLETPVPPNPELLVLIASVSSGNDDVNADSAFATFGPSSGFGNGTDLMYTPKHWTQPVRQPGVKQVAATGPGYELTFEVSTPGGMTAP
jgi:hypothetical protein